MIVLGIMLWVAYYFATKNEHWPVIGSTLPNPPVIAPVIQPTYHEVYHGTPTWINTVSLIQNGLIPGPRQQYGCAVYTTFDFKFAQLYAQGGGFILKLYINKNTPFSNYSQIPGSDVQQKREFCLRNGWGFIFVERDNFFISFGYIDVPVRIPGLELVEVFDENGNPIIIK